MNGLAARRRHRSRKMGEIEMCNQQHSFCITLHCNMLHVFRQPLNFSFDCGVFTCAYLLHLAMGYVEEMPFTQVKSIVLSMMRSRGEQQVVLVAVVVVVLLLLL